MEKIFGIGLSRTGTTSLTNALRVLGYTSVHYPKYYHDSYFKIHIDEHVLNEFDSLTDVPVAHQYKNLDAKYPNAKFILTVRDEDSWIKSVTKFFTTGNNSRGYLIDVLRFINPKNNKWRSNYLLRHRIYGSFKFKKDKYLSAYKSHNESVINHFKNKNHKLLVVDLINEPNKWQKLCDFLGKDIPNVDFPHKNNAQK